MFVKKRKLLSSSNFLLFGTEILIDWGCGWAVFLAKGTTSRHFSIVVTLQLGEHTFPNRLTGKKPLFCLFQVGRPSGVRDVGL